MWQEILGQGISDTSNMLYNGITNYYWNNWQADREDSAVTRYAADLQRAGLSRTLAAGGQAHTNAPVVSQAHPTNLGEAVMRGAMTDLAKRDQDNKDRLAEAQINNINADSELLRARAKREIPETGLAELEYNAYDQRLQQELKESASRIEHAAQQNKESAQRIVESGQNVRQSQQQVLESKSRITLNKSQVALNEQAIEKGRYAIKQMQAEIENLKIKGHNMRIESTIAQMNATAKAVDEMLKMREGRSTYSTLGKMATDLINAFSGFRERADSYMVFMEEFNRLAKSLSSQ